MISLILLEADEDDLELDDDFDAEIDENEDETDNNTNDDESDSEDDTDDDNTGDNDESDETSEDDSTSEDDIDSEEDNSKEIESNFFESEKNELLFQNYYGALDDIGKLSEALKSVFDSSTFSSEVKAKLFNISTDLEDLKRKIEKIIKNFSKITYEKKEHIFRLCMKSITSSSDDINSIIGTERANND